MASDASKLQLDSGGGGAANSAVTIPPTTEAAPSEDSPHAQALALQSALHGILAHTAFVLKARTHARDASVSTDPQRAGLVPEPSLVPLANECQKYKRICKGLGDWVLNAQAVLEAELVHAEARESAAAAEAQKTASSSTGTESQTDPTSGQLTRPHTASQVEAIDIDAVDAGGEKEVAMDAIDLTGDSPEAPNKGLPSVDGIADEQNKDSKTNVEQGGQKNPADPAADPSPSKDPMALLASLGGNGDLNVAATGESSAPIDLSAFQFGTGGVGLEDSEVPTVGGASTNDDGADEASAAAAALMSSLTGGNATGAGGDLMGDMGTSDDQFSTLDMGMGMGMSMGNFDLSDLDFGESNAFSGGGDLQQNTSGPGIEGIDFAALLQGFDDGTGSGSG